MLLVAFGARRTGSRPCRFFWRHGEHELDAVELVDLGGARVVVDGHDVGLGVSGAQRPEHALADDVVGQAREGLGADDVRAAVFDHVDHFCGQVPAFAGLVARRADVLGTLDHLFDGPMRLKLAVRRGERAVYGLLVLLERPQNDRHDVALLAVDAQVLLVPSGGRHRVVEERA